MLEWLLRIAILLLYVTVIEILYNAIVFRKTNPRRWLYLIASAAGVTIIGGALLWGVGLLRKIPFLGVGVKYFDKLFTTFAGYLPVFKILLYIAIPIALIWVVYLGLTFYQYIAIKSKYTKYISKQNQDTAPETKTPKSKKKHNLFKKKDSASTVDEPNTQEPPTEEIKQPTVSINALTDKSQSQSEAPNPHFLSIETKPIRYQSPFGLKRALTESADGLRIGETPSGYVALYSNHDGFISLQRLLSENSLDITELVDQPSVVEFNQSTITADSYDDYIANLKKVK